MLEHLREGFLGLFLVVGMWLSPGTDRPGLSIAPPQLSAAGYQISCEMNVAWTDQMGQLVDAGVPVHFRISAVSSNGDTLAFVRTLHFDIADNSYMYTDSSLCSDSGYNARSKKYPQILLALRDLCRWNFIISKHASSCRCEVSLLPSHVSRLNRMVDMSALWGQSRLVKIVVLKE